ncbi:MAG: hypothetical protein GY868_12865, partial [Deltaproteobacteria bacterium]|nr:hypothetical protein [Deltaproteobacteria bacterium]
AYNRDLQEDKESLFDTVETVKRCLHVFALMIPEITVNRDRMLSAAEGGFLTATDLADYLATKGVPFRTAHEVVGQVVAYCVKAGKSLWDLDAAELRRFSADIEADALEWLSLNASVNSRTATGATGCQAVKKALTRSKALLRKGRKFIDITREKMDTGL